MLLWRLNINITLNFNFKKDISDVKIMFFLYQVNFVCSIETTATLRELWKECEKSIWPWKSSYDFFSTFAKECVSCKNIAPQGFMLLQRYSKILFPFRTFWIPFDLNQSCYNFEVMTLIIAWLYQAIKFCHFCKRIIQTFEL